MRLRLNFFSSQQITFTFAERQLMPSATVTKLPLWVPQDSDAKYFPNDISANDVTAEVLPGNLLHHAIAKLLSTDCITFNDRLGQAFPLVIFREATLFAWAELCRSLRFSPISIKTITSYGTTQWCSQKWPTDLVPYIAYHCKRKKNKFWLPPPVNTFLFAHLPPI